MNNTAYPDQGQTMRQPASAILGIDSADRYTIDTDTGLRIDKQPEYNFSLYKGQSVLNGFIKRLGLTEINMEWNVPNVNSYNNQFAIGITSTDISNGATDVATPQDYIIRTEVDIGFYTPIELAAALEARLNNTLTVAGVLINGATADLQVYIDPKTLSVQLVADLGTGIGEFFVPYVGVAPFTTVDTRNCTMYQMLGLNSLLTSYTLSPASGSGRYEIYGSYASYLYTRYIDIVSENLTKKQEVKDSSTQPPEIGASNLLARLYIGNSGLSESRFDISGMGCNIVGTRPFQLYKEYKSPKYIYWDSREFINLIDIKVYDDAGRPLYEQAEQQSVNAGAGYVAGNTAEFQITILASEN